MEEEEEDVEEAEAERKCCGVVESGIHTWTHSVHVPRVYLEGKVELTYWDRSDRLVAFMYPPVSVCRAEMIPLLFLPLPPAIYSPSLKTKTILYRVQYRG